MKTYQVKINRRSIKPNPDAGQTSIVEHISTTATITVNGKHLPLEKFDDRIRMTRSTHGYSSKSKVFETTEYVVVGQHADIVPMLEALHRKYDKNITINIQNHFETFNLLHPVPSHSFEYRKTKVTCQHCKANFTHDKLRDFDDWDDEGCYIGRANVCPKCDKEDACHLEFQTLEDVMLQKAKVPKYATHYR